MKKLSSTFLMVPTSEGQSEEFHLRNSSALMPEESRWSLAPDTWDLDSGPPAEASEISNEEQRHLLLIESPKNISLLQQVVVSDFNLTARVQMSATSQSHQEFCVVFGYQDTSHYYCLRLDPRMDGRCSVIFIVNGTNPKALSRPISNRIPWNDGRPHHVRVERNSVNGQIRVYLDDLQDPILECVDQTFTQGLVGISSLEGGGKVDQVDLKGVGVR